MSCKGLGEAKGLCGVSSIVEDCPTKEMTVYEFDPLLDPRWDKFIETHPRSSVFHSRNWMRALRNSYGYEPFAVSTSSPGYELTNGLVFCRIKSWLTGRRVVALPFSDHCEPLVNNDDELDCRLNYVTLSVDRHKEKYVEIRPILAKPGVATKLEPSMAYYLHCIDIQKDIQDVFRGFHKDCVIRKIRRADKESLDYEEGRSEELLEKFYQLLLITRRRQHLPPQPRQWFRQLAVDLGDSLKVRVVSKDGVPIASIITILHKKTMTYKYGSSDSRYHRLGGTALLFWTAIQEAKEMNCHVFDLGRSNVDNDGLIAFKEHWGASRSLVSYWRHPHTLDREPSAWKAKVVNKAVLIAPDVALVAIGQFLYPHIG